MSEYDFDPSFTNQDKAILIALYEGVTVTKACKTNGITVQSWCRRCDRSPALAAEYGRARAAGVDALVDGLDDILDRFPNPEQIQQAKLVSDNIKWAASKRNPAKYSDRLEIGVTHIDLTGAIAEARNRLRPVSDQGGDVIDVEPVMVRLPEVGATDNKSAAEVIAVENVIPDFLK